MNQFFQACAASLLFSGFSALAQDLSFEISPFYGYRFGGSLQSSTGESLSLKAGPSYGLALDVGPRDSDMKFELLWSRQESGVDFNGLGNLREMDVTVDEFMFGCIYERGQGKFHEYYTGLVGATVFGPDGGDSTAYFGIEVGGGVKYFVLKNLALHVDLRGFCNFVETQGAVFSSGGYTVAYFSGSLLWQGEVSAGLTLSF